jgi:hypothetical protein
MKFTDTSKAVCDMKHRSRDVKPPHFVFICCTKCKEHTGEKMMYTNVLFNVIFCYMSIAFGLAFPETHVPQLCTVL